MTKRAGRSREGAWIEMPALIIAPVSASVAPARERGLKLLIIFLLSFSGKVAPARERGLKLKSVLQMLKICWSLPRGSVD